MRAVPAEPQPPLATAEPPATRALRLGFLVLAFMPAVLLAIHPVDSADLGFQLATGEWIAAHQAVPRHDPFGTLPADRTWIAHDWLATLGMAAVHTLGGAYGLVLWAALLQLAALGLPLALAYRRRMPLVPYAAALLVATCIAYERFFVRPEAWSLAFASLFAVLFARGAPRSWRSLAAIAGLQALWTNLHAAFVLGPAIAALAAAADLVRRWRGGNAAAVRAPRLAAPVALALACCLTPYGAGIALRIVGAGRTIGAGDLQRSIVEWQPTFASPLTSDFVLLVFVASLAGTGIAALVGRRHIRLFEALLVAAAIALGVSSRRHLVLYAVLVPPVAAAWVARALAAHARPRLEIAAVGVSCVVAVGLALDIASGAFAARFGPPRRLGFGFDDEVLPVRAADFVGWYRLPGPIFNNITAGSALVWRLRGTPPPLVDGRLLDPERFRSYRECLESMPAFDAWTAQHGTRLVVLGLQPHPPVQLFRHLQASDDWWLVSFDASGAVFATDSLAKAFALRRIALDVPLPPLGSKSTAATLGFATCDPGPSASRGTMLVQLGYATAAIDDLSRALLNCPNRADVKVPLALAFVADGRPQAARPLIEQVLAQDPLDVDAWVAAGLVSHALGDRDGARDAWSRAAALAPDDRRPRRYLESLGEAPPRR